MATTPTVDLTEARAGVEAVAERVVALVRSGGDLARPVPGLSWTVGEVAAHLVAVCRLYPEAVEGRPGRWMQPYLRGPDDTPSRLAVGNADSLTQVPHDDRRGLANALAHAAHAFLALTAGRPGDVFVPTPWFGEGQSRTLGTLTGLFLGELLVHGYDMAKAVGWRWPIEPAHARVVLAALPSMLASYVDRDRVRGASVSYMVHVRGGTRFAIRFVEGAVTVERSAPRVDCHISADPVAFLLVGYGRIGQWGAIARGELVAWGRRPWAAFSLTKLFHKP